MWTDCFPFRVGRIVSGAVWQDGFVAVVALGDEAAVDQDSEGAVADVGSGVRYIGGRNEDN